MSRLQESRAGRVLSGLCLCAALCAVPQAARTQPAPVSLVGVWESTSVDEPALRGELTVTRAGSNWKATISGVSAAAASHDSRIEFRFPNDLGQFRGDVGPNGTTIEGFWCQPATAENQALASPVVLARWGPSAWRGFVRPLVSRFTLYLRIFRNADGTLTGAFRNPETNSRGGAGQFSVTQTGVLVHFSAQPDPSQPPIKLGAELLNAPDRLQIYWPDVASVLQLKRLTTAEAAAFYPRPPGSAPYRYRQPPNTGDGWVTARARDVGMDEALLAQLVQQVSTSDPSVRRPALIHSLLVARHGKLVLEEYFFGFDRDQPHDLRSAGKTFAAVMLGTAMLQGAHVNTGTHVYRLLSAMGPFAHQDARKDEITIGQLMTHTSGLACDDNSDSSPGSEDAMQSQTAQPDWWKYTLDLPMAHEPGAIYAYCSGGMNLVGAALTTATNTWLPEYFDRTVARPLHFGSYYWNLMPTGEGYLGGGAFVRPRDLLKIGQMYLDGGVWNGKRIVSSTWVASSTAQHVAINPATTGLSADVFPNFYGVGADGFAWHLGWLHARDHTYREYGATGNGGQLLIVVPELDMTVVFTAGNFGQGGIWSRFRSRLVPEQIIPAIRH